MNKGWPEPRHKPTISHTSLTKFLSCSRAYALQYHHNIIPDLDVRFEHKREARLQPLNCFPGSVFHETVQRALMHYRNSGEFPVDLLSIAQDVMREYIAFSKEWVAEARAHPILGGMYKYWPEHSFAQPIESYYYETDLPKQYRAVLKEKLIRWFERFTTLISDLPFSHVEPDGWLFPVELGKAPPWFVHNNRFAVYAAFDFLTRQADRIAIYDWKTGRRQSGEETLASQLITYAAFAIQNWNVAPENIELYGVWVDDGSIQRVECDEAEVGRILEFAEINQRELASRLNQVNGDAKRLFELFPMTNNIRTCHRCNFRTCAGRNREPQIPSLELQKWEFSDD